MNITELQLLFKNMLSNNIKLNIIVNYILLLKKGRFCFQIDKYNLNTLEELEYLKNINKKYNIKLIKYNDINNNISDNILDTFFICILQENYNSLNIKKIKENDTYYIGNILDIDYPIKNYRQLYLYTDDTCVFQLKIVANFNNNIWDINNENSIYNFDDTITDRDNIVIFMTNNYYNPKSFKYISIFQKIFYNLQIPVKFHIEMDARPTHWKEIKKYNFIPIYN